MHAQAVYKADEFDESNEPRVYDQRCSHMQQYTSGKHIDIHTCTHTHTHTHTHTPTHRVDIARRVRESVRLLHAIT